MYAITTKPKGNSNGRFVYTHPYFSPYEQFAYTDTESVQGSTLEPRVIRTANLIAGGAYAEKGQKYQLAPEGVHGAVQYLDGTAIGNLNLPDASAYFTSEQYYGHSDGVAQPSDAQAAAMRVHVEDPRRLNPRFEDLPGGAFAEQQMGMRYELEEVERTMLNEGFATVANAMQVAHAVQSQNPFVRESVPIPNTARIDTEQAFAEDRLEQALSAPRLPGSIQMRQTIMEGLY